MNAVGIDVSKGKSMVAIMRPFGEIVSTPFEIKHTASDIHSLVELIKDVYKRQITTSTVIAWRRNIPYSLAVRKMIEEINAFQA